MAEYNGVHTDLTVTNNALCTVVTVCNDDLVYTFGGDGCRIAFGDLSVETDECLLGSRALPRAIYDILKDAASQGALSLIGSPDKETAEYRGESGGSAYTIVCDRKTGALRQITSKTAGISLTFG